jgi:hypothetical protein
MSFRRPLFAEKEDKREVLSNRLVHGTISKNAGLSKKVNKAGAISVTKILDKDLKNQHETTVERKNRRLSEVLSDAMNILKLVAEMGDKPHNNATHQQIDANVALRQQIGAIQQELDELPQRKDAREVDDFEISEKVDYA